MSRPDGAHTHGGGGFDGAWVVILAAVLIGTGVVSAALSAITRLLELAAIITGCAIGLAVLGGLGWLVYRARSGPRRSDRPGRPIAPPLARQLPPAERPVLSADHKPAIEPPRETHLHFHVSAAELAAILRHHTEEK
jgi:hypothetical protein